MDKPIELEGPPAAGNQKAAEAELLDITPETLRHVAGGQDGTAHAKPR